ncbi:MAG: 2-phospho-L-lactate transferase [Chloroflexi bacterium]|nr:2-phospho-L-lactate transferase [Chloroflexota bacterium]
MNIVALAGGVGGAKLAHGLTLVAANPRVRLGQSHGIALTLTVVVNTGDDFDWNGLRVCPDLDTVTYTLGGLANPDTGWGVAGDTFECLGALQRLGQVAWFKIGDRDLAMHVRRTALLAEGKSLTEATAILTRALNIRATILPMTDNRFRTLVDTDAGVLEFQDYFVRRQWQPVIKRIIFDGTDSARATPQVNDALARADAIIFCPSNPFVSIEPILSLIPAPSPENAKIFSGEGSRPLPLSRNPLFDFGRGGRGVRLAVSPIVGGQALKGPAAKMFRELGIEPSAFAVAQRYQHIITHFVLDHLDGDQENAIQSLGLRTLVTDTWMKSIDDRARLAGEIIEFIMHSS